MTVVPMVSRRRRWRVIAPLVLVLLAASLAVTIRSSSADADLGTLTLSPRTGTASTANINLTTISQGNPAGCPDGASQATVTITGPGGWAGGIAFTAFKSLSPGSEQVIPLSPTFGDAAASSGAAIEVGRYDITVACKDRLGATSFGAYTASIWFTDANDWQDSDPSTSTTVTEIALQDDPVGRVTEGRSVTLTATVTPANAVGTVKFLDTSGTASAQIGSSVDVADGQARVTVSSLEFGLHYLSAEFVPADAARFAPSTTAAPPLNFVVAHRPPDGGG